MRGYDSDSKKFKWTRRGRSSPTSAYLVLYSVAFTALFLLFILS